MKKKFKKFLKQRLKDADYMRQIEMAAYDADADPWNIEDFQRTKIMIIVEDYRANHE